MKKDGKLLLVLVFTLALVVLAACGAPAVEEPPVAEPEAEEPVAAEETDGEIDMEYTEWTLPTVHSTSQIYFQQMQTFADNVFERTGGKLKINVYASGELPYDGYEFIQILSAGTVEMCMPELGYVGGELPIMDIPSYPMLVSNNDEMMTALEASKPYWDAKLDDLGVTNLGYWSMNGLGIFGVGEPPTCFDDLAGRQVRVYDTASSELLAKVGVIPVSIAWSEVVPSLQRGVCDAAYTGIVSAWEAGFQEVIDWAYWCQFVGCAGFICVNDDALNSLPTEVQEILFDEGQKMTESSFAYNEENTQKDFDLMADMGIECSICTEEDYAMLESHCEELWLANAGAIGEDGLECLQAIRDALGK